MLISGQFHELSMRKTGSIGYFLYCDWKACVANAQSFTLWQQATIEITYRDHSISACLRHRYMGVVVHAHPICNESHIPHNTNQEFATLATRLFTLVEMTESDRQVKFKPKKLHINNLQSNLIVRHHFLTCRPPFHSMLGTIFQLIESHFIA